MKSRKEVLDAVGRKIIEMAELPVGDVDKLNTLIYAYAHLLREIEKTQPAANKLDLSEVRDLTVKAIRDTGGAGQAPCDERQT